MVRSKFSIVVYFIIALALIGIVSQLFTNPLAFLKGIFVTIGIGVALFAVVYFIFFRNKAYSQSNEMKKYKQAVRQSKIKYKTSYNRQPTKTKKEQYRMKRRSNQRQTHLRVIEGNRDKPKRKNRATF